MKEQTMFEKLDSLKVMAAAGGATGISLTDAELILKCASWSVAIGYALWKWRADVLKNRKENNEES